MQWGPQQVETLDKVGRWLNSGSAQVYHLFGYAGSGKTTLAKHIRNMANGKVGFGAYTGKAAHVLRTKGCDNAKTLHSMIYHSREKSRAHLEQLEKERQEIIAGLTMAGLTPEQIAKDKHYVDIVAQIKQESNKSDQPYFVKNPESEVADLDLLIIDECSMVDNRMGEDLLSFGTKVLVLGDPAQLPPVGGEGYFTKDVTPDSMLTEIHRQAADNPIIRMATEVRNEKPLSLGDYGDGCRVIGKDKMDPEEVLGFDQILVGKNKTRFASNRKLRKLKGIDDPYPVVGDRLVCLKNNSELGLLNGALFFATDIMGVMDGKVAMSVRPEDDMASIQVIAHEHHFLGTDNELAWFEKKEAEMFDFGYALTVHKSQGSQWNSVCLLNESYCFRADRWKWLYTGITRAAHDVTVVNM